MGESGRWVLIYLYMVIFLPIYLKSTIGAYREN